ncbi:hypothetical protein [Streptomyces sp. NPDC059828]|uniref:hypothetical protein n=1 Tax=Streptomyces sp. NPDC059828 TaxID=3346965 RepID=UPI003652CAA6
MSTVRTEAAQGSGALRLVESRTTGPASVDFTEYVAAMSVHCPYLAPSVQHGLTGWTVYEAAGGPSGVEAEVFRLGVEFAERVRGLAKRPRGSLVCENIAVFGADREVLAWPHWALKNLYAPVGVMFGKFPTGEQGSDHLGRQVPEPPVSFLVVRAAVPVRDPHFLSRTPNLAATVAASADDGRDVFAAQRLPRTWTEVKRWAQRRLPGR